MVHEEFDHDQKSRALWWLAMLCGVLTLVFGTIGVWLYEHQPGGPADHGGPQSSHGLSPFYHAVQMLILHTSHFDRGVNLWIELGRWCGVVTFFAAASALFWKRLQREFLLLRLRGWAGHYVICGLGHKGLAIAMCLREAGRRERVVVLDPNPDARFAEVCLLSNICVLQADATEPTALLKARVPYAKEIVVITPDDPTNVRIGKEVCLLRPARAGEPPPCKVNLSDIHLCDALQKWMETDAGRQTGGALQFFDVFDQEARRVLLNLPLDDGGIATDDPRSVHVVILGFGRMGRSLALRAAKMGHFANGKPLRISVIDRCAKEQEQRFLFRHPALQDGGICRIEFFPGEAESLGTRERVLGWAKEPGVLLHVFVCLDSDTRAVEVGLRLQMALGRAAHTLNLRIHAKKSLVPILEENANGLTPIRVFGMVEDACSDAAFRQSPNEQLAQAIHEQFVLNVRATTSRTPETDPALRDWERLHEVFRESNRQQADHIAIKLRAIGCDLESAEDPREPIRKIEDSLVERLAPVEHRRWLAERRLAGWRYGTPANKDEKISEYLVSWDELPESVRDYDRQAISDIPSILKLSRLGLKIVWRQPEAS